MNFNSAIHMIIQKVSNTYYFKLAGTIIFLFSGVKYTSVVYEYGIYFMVIWGCMIFCNLIYQRKIRFIAIDFLLVFFVLSYIVTMILNFQNHFLKQGFVLASCIMYFMSFFSSSCVSRSQLNKENKRILQIICIYTFISLIMSFIALFMDMLRGTSYSYNLQGGYLFQLIGIYSTLSTQAIFSGLSALCSVYFIVAHLTKESIISKKAMIFYVSNFIIQDYALTLAYTSAGVAAFGCAIFVGFCILGSKIIPVKKRLYKYILVGCLGLGAVFFNYYVMNLCGQYTVEGVSHVITNTQSVDLKTDDAVAQIASSNGRAPIWKAAINQWRRSAFFGIGYGNFFMKMNLPQGGILEYRDVHSGYLEVLVSCGVLGFLSIILYGGYHFLRFIFKLENNWLTFGWMMILVYAGLYAAVNQLFILDRAITVFLICIALGMSRNIFLQKAKASKKDIKST